MTKTLRSAKRALEPHLWKMAFAAAAVVLAVPIYLLWNHDRYADMALRHSQYSRTPDSPEDEEWHSDAAREYEKFAAQPWKPFGPDARYTRCPHCLRR